MAEYIEREAILNRLNKVHMDNRPFDAGVQFGVDHAISCVIEAPAADVAPVVRCRECIHRDGTPGQPNILCFQMKDDDFCSYGKRR